MKKILFITFVVIHLFACKKSVIITNGLSGIWEIQKSEVTSYTSGVEDNTVVLEDLGELWLENEKGNADDFNTCRFNFVSGYYPEGIRRQLNITFAMQNNEANWYGDTNTRNRLTIWANGGFADSPIFVIYTRKKNGSKEEWTYIELEANGQMRLKEVLYAKLTETGNGPF